MNVRFLAFVALIVALCLPDIALAQSVGTISFSPAHPTNTDLITVKLTPVAGQPDWCPFQFSFPSSNAVFIDAAAVPCSPGFGTTNQVVIGTLPAGIYQVIWGFHDNFNNVPVPTATLAVSSAPSEIPALSPEGILSLVFCLALLGRGANQRGMRPNYSLKRTAANRHGVN
jgi:hypothetical protein